MLLREMPCSPRLRMTAWFFAALEAERDRCFPPAFFFPAFLLRVLSLALAACACALYFE